MKTFVAAMTAVLCAAALPLALLITAGISEAQTGLLPSPNLAAGQVAEVITPAAAVVSTSHYQAQLALNCVGNFCSGDFPRPGKNRQLSITRMSCHMIANTGSTLQTASATLATPNNTSLAVQFISNIFTSSTGFHHTLNQAVDIEVAARRHIHIQLNLTTSDTANSGVCTATGTLSILQ